MIMACDGVHVRVLWLFWAQLGAAGTMMAAGYGTQWGGSWSGGCFGLLQALCRSWSSASGGGKGRMACHVILGTLGLVSLQFLVFYLASNVR